MEPIIGKSAVRMERPNKFPTRNDNNTKEKPRIIELIPSGGQLLISLHPLSPKSKSGNEILILLSSIKLELNKQGTNTTILGASPTGRNEKKLEIIQNEEDIYLFIHPKNTYETGWAAITQKATLTQAINELT